MSVDGASPVNGGDERIGRQVRQNKLLAQLLVLLVVVVDVVHDLDSVGLALSGGGPGGGDLLLDQVHVVKALLRDQVLLVRVGAAGLGAGPVENLGDADERVLGQSALVVRFLLEGSFAGLLERGNHVSDLVFNLVGKGA